MQLMFVRQLFSQVVAEKLVNDQKIDSPGTLASLTDIKILQSVM